MYLASQIQWNLTIQATYGIDKMYFNFEVVLFLMFLCL